MARKLFGEILVEQGLVSQQDLDVALKLQQQQPPRSLMTIGQILNLTGFVEDADLIIARLAQTREADEQTDGETGVIYPAKILGQDMFDIELPYINPPELQDFAVIEAYVIIGKKDLIEGKVSLQSLANQAKIAIARNTVDFCEFTCCLKGDIDRPEYKQMKALEAECRDFLENECALQEVEKSEGDPLVDLEGVAEELESETAIR